MAFEEVTMGDARLILADCRDVLPIEADAVISDPPYGMNWNTDSTRFSGGVSALIRRTSKDGRADWGDVANDSEPFDPSHLLTFKTVVLFGCNHYAARLPVGTSLVWIKKYDHLFGTFLSDAEVAWMKGGHGVYCFRDVSLLKDTKGRQHPTQKPVALMAWCMERAKVPEGATVLDPYMGSASTGIACLRTGRKFIGIEKDPVHFEGAVKRIDRELAQARLFA